MNIDELNMIWKPSTPHGLAEDMGTTWIWLHYGLKLFDGLALLAGIAVVVYGIFGLRRRLTTLTQIRRLLETAVTVELAFKGIVTSKSITKPPLRLWS
jgi:hypothetical protein